MNNLLVKVKEKQYGPLSRCELRSLARKGKFSPRDLVWSEEDGEWIEAEKMKQLKQLFDVDVDGQHEKRVMAIASGKGGVGKTVLAVSLGVGLSALGKEVILVDGDFGGANLHTCMGILEPEYTFFDYYTLQRETLEDIILDTPIENLKLISGACGTLGLANPRYSQKLRLIRELKELPADYIILDLGAGSSFNVIDFFLAVEDRVIVTNPEPTAIQEAFDFIKLCLMRKLQQTFKNEPRILSVLDLNGMNTLSQFKAPIGTLLEQVAQINEHSASIFESVLEGFQPMLILNKVMESDEIKEGLSIKMAAAELLGVEVDYLGYIEYDDSIHKSVKELRPFLLHNPRSKASRSVAKLITIKLLKKGRLGAMIDKRRLRKRVSEDAQEYPSADSYEKDTICSVKCFYWDDCEYQKGGFPCSIRHLEPIFKG